MMRKTQLFCVVVLATLFVRPLQAQLLKTQQQALSEAFAKADTVIRKTLFLDDTQRKKLEKQANSAFSSNVITYYIGIKDGRALGYAFFEKQVVRTKEAIAMIVVTPTAEVERVEVLVFREPQDYLPIRRWFALFQHQRLGPELWPGRAIHAVSGATLSARAFSQMVRRALALYSFIESESE